MDTLRIVEAVMQRVSGGDLALEGLRERESDASRADRRKARTLAPPMEWAFLAVNALTPTELRERIKSAALIEAVRELSETAADEIDDMPETTAEVLAEVDRDHDERIAWIAEGDEVAAEQADAMSKSYGGERL